MTRKTRYDRSGLQTIEFRNLKNVNKESFLNDLELIPWEQIDKISDPNEMHTSYLTGNFDKHTMIHSSAPLHHGKSEIFSHGKVPLPPSNLYFNIGLH